MSRSSIPEFEVAADALAALASLVRSGRGLRQALIEWPDVAPVTCSDSVARISGAVKVGGCIGSVSAFAADRSRLAASLLPALSAAAEADRWGAALTTSVLDAQIANLRRRAVALAEAEAGTSGARLSGRLVAGLPLAFLLIVPTAAHPPRDRMALLLLVLGAGLVMGGMRWISRLMPGFPDEAPAGAVARELAALMATGAPASVALRMVAEHKSWGPLNRAERATLLGLGWVDALKAVEDESAGTLATILDTGRRVGHGSTAGLSRFADEISARSQREFEARLRRAPVLMVVPLTLCLLPGFALLTVGPFLRELIT